VTRLRVRCGTCGGEPDFTDPTEPVCLGCQLPGDNCTCASVYDRIGRLLIDFHDWQERSADSRRLSLGRNPGRPPSSPAEIADALERLVAAAKVTASTDSIRVDSWQRELA